MKIYPVYYLKHFEILTYKAKIVILNQHVEGQNVIKKSETNFPLLNLP